MTNEELVYQQIQKWDGKVPSFVVTGRSNCEDIFMLHSNVHSNMYYISFGIAIFFAFILLVCLLNSKYSSDSESDRGSNTLLIWYMMTSFMR